MYSPVRARSSCQEGAKSSSDQGLRPRLQGCKAFRARYLDQTFCIQVTKASLRWRLVVMHCACHPY